MVAVADSRLSGLLRVCWRCLPRLRSGRRCRTRSRRPSRQRVAAASGEWRARSPDHAGFGRHRQNAPCGYAGQRPRHRRQLVGGAAGCRSDGRRRSIWHSSARQVSRPLRVHQCGRSIPRCLCAGLTRTPVPQRAGHPRRSTRSGERGTGNGERKGRGGPAQRQPLLTANGARASTGGIHYVPRLPFPVPNLCARRVCQCPSITSAHAKARKASRTNAALISARV